jgi:integrase
MKLKLPKHVTRDSGKGADGKERFYYRRPGQKKIRIKGTPYTPSFMAAYEAAQSGTPITPQPLVKQEGTFAWLCDEYFSSGEFGALDGELTKPKYRNTLLTICREPVKPGSSILFGDVPITQWNKKAVRAIRDRADKIGTKNDRLRVVRSIFRWAVEDADHIDVNPARDVSYVELANKKGFHSWTIQEVEQFEATHPVGTQERLAMGMLLFAGQRKSDVALFGPASIKDGWFVFTQQKNRRRKPVDMEIPVRPELLALIEATPCGAETFLVNSHGKPYTRRNFSHWFAKACIKAKVPGRSHGLRKAAAARLAELGASEKEIMSITGHSTSKEIKRYTDAADKRILAEKATARSVRKVG